MNKTILSLFFLAIIGLTTNVEARTECAALSCSASFCGTGIFLSQDPNIIGCTRSEKCTGAGYVCAATSNGYRLTTKCAVMECPEGCKSCCSSTNGKAICTRCEEGYKASGDDCVPIHGDLPRCDINENTYPTKIKCLANCTSGVCKNCMDIEVMTSAWQCEEHEVLCTVSNCKTCLPGKNECATCDDGYEWNSSTNTCRMVACPPGKYYDSGVCKPCPAGSFTSTEGATACIPCIPGYWSEQGSSSCTKVNCAQFNPQHGRCVLCTHYGCDELECDENYEANYLTKTCESSSTVQNCRVPFVLDSEQKCCIPPPPEQGEAG